MTAVRREWDAGAADGRRFLIVVGVERYANTGIAALPGVAGDVVRVRKLLEPMGYQPVLAELALNPRRGELAEGIEDWAVEADLGPEDIVVVYFAGHGARPGDRHYLLCSDFRPGRWASALAAEDLARPLVTSPVGHLLVMLDTCYAGAGVADIAQLAGELAHTHHDRANRWHLAAARAKETAKENVFVDALTDVFRRPRHGATQQFLSVREVTERVNAHFRAHRPTQHARLTTVDSDGQDPFFPSSIFLSDLPADGMDVASLARLRRRHAGHFGPRSRGLEHAGESGDYFTGRTRAQQELAAFLSADRHDRKARVVTGDPGSGKSALLGRVLATSDPDHPLRRGMSRAAADAGGGAEDAAGDRADSDAGAGGRPDVLTVLPPASVSVIALHARRITLDDLVTDLAGALGLPAPSSRDDVLAALGSRTAAVTVVVDALDEAGTAGDAGEGSRIARELLQPVSSLSSVRLIVGTRRPLIPALGHAVEVIDLDLPAYIAEDDIADYALAVLEDAQDPDSLSPYRDSPGLAATVAGGIAERAGASYLVARMTARALVHGQIHIDPARPGWRERLPSDAKQAFAAYLDRFGPDRPKVERLLRPLAYAQGAGLPWSTLWGAVAQALSGMPCPQDDLHWLQANAGAYIIESPTPDGSAYRLFHETMAEHLRRPGHEHDDHATIAAALTALVTSDPTTGLRDWPAAHPYTRRHAATHAAAGGTLDTLLRDPEYLVHAHHAPLLRVLDTTTAPAARLTAAIYRASADVHTPLRSSARRDILAVDAARFQQPHLAACLSRTRPWTPRWATGTLVNPAHRATLVGDGTVRVWDLATGTERAVLTGRAGSVGAVVVTEIDGCPHAVTAGRDRTVRVRNLTTGREHAVLVGHTSWVSAVAVAVIDGRLHAVTISRDASVRVWDLTTGTARAVLAGHTNAVSAVVVAEIDGRPHAVTTGDDGTVRVWDLVTGTERAVLSTDGDWTRVVAVTMVDGRPHAVTAGDAGTVRVWDLNTGTQRAVLTGHIGPVSAVAVTDLDGRPHAVTTSRDGTVRVWDVTTGTGHAVLVGHASWVSAVAVTDLDGRPHAVTTSRDRTVRVWDLLLNRASAVLSLPLDCNVIAVHGSDIILGMANEVVVLQRAVPRPWRRTLASEGGSTPPPHEVTPPDGM